MGLNRPFILHLDLADFFAVPGVAGEVVYHECTSRPLTYASITTGFETMLSASFLAADGVHAVRIVIERMEIGARHNDRMPVPMAERAELARGAFRGHCQLHARLPIGGLMLVPGMAEELNKISTSHELWRWEKGAGGERQLVVTPLPGAELASE